MSLNTLIRKTISLSNSIEKEKERKIMIWNSLDPSENYEWFEIENLDFNSENNRLEFIVKKYTQKPKITRYVTSNYIKTPIYGDYSTTSRIYKKFNKIINLEKFMNIDILELGIDHELILYIIDYLDYVPYWRKKEIRIEEVNLKISEHNLLIRDFLSEKKDYSYNNNYLSERQSNLILRLFFIPFTLGFSLKGFISKKKSILNAKHNTKIREYNSIHKGEVDNFNVNLENEIIKNNNKIYKTIDKLNKKILDIENEKYDIVPNEKGWTMVKEASLYNFSEIKNIKGVYIIKNLNKNIYYVGQSKNIGKRLNQHFKNGEVVNIKFAKDWYEGNVFGFKYIQLETKDLLDSEEKRLIDYYDSFNNGYNNTGGNI